MCAFFVSHITQRVRVFADFTADFCGRLLLFFPFFSFLSCAAFCMGGAPLTAIFSPKVICMVLCISNLSYRLTYSSRYSAYSYPSCMSVPLNMIKTVCTSPQHSILPKTSCLSLPRWSFLQHLVQLTQFTTNPFS